MKKHDKELKDEMMDGFSEEIDNLRKELAEKDQSIKIFEKLA